MFFDNSSKAHVLSSKTVKDMDDLVEKDQQNACPAIQVENLSKCYRVYKHPRDRILQALWRRPGLSRSPATYCQEFWALRQLSFEVERGRTLGVVGRNGSGKSTLLQLICGTLAPSTGFAKVRGRVGALLELGSGFNMEFSGLENVHLNAALLGLSRAEIDAKLDQILAFADIGDFVHQPVKTYSSGMVVRLAFAVQAHINPDVLVVDEALAVGDELFQKKCYAHLERLKEQGTSILLVTHSNAQIMQHCDEALLLHKGKARLIGSPAKIIVFYQRILNTDDSKFQTILEQGSHGELGEEDEPVDDNGASTNPALSGNYPAKADADTDENQLIAGAFYDPGLRPQSTEIYPSQGGEIYDAWVENLKGEKVNILPFGEDFALVICHKSEKELAHVAMSCYLASHTGQGISGQSIPAQMGARPGGNILAIPASRQWQARYTFKGGLWPGVYLISAALVTFAPEGKRFIHRVIDFRAIRILDCNAITPLGACSLSTQPGELEGLEI